MKTDRNLMYKHSDLFSDIYKANPSFDGDGSGEIICPSCDFKEFYKNQTLSIEVCFSKVIAHYLEMHDKTKVGA